MLLGMIADGLFFWPLPQSSAGIFVRSVRALFHSDVSQATVSLQIKHIGFVLPTGSTNAYLTVHSLKFAIFGINFSFCVGVRARHKFRLLIKQYPSQIDLAALLTD